MNKSIITGFFFTNSVFLYTAYMSLGSFKRLFDSHAFVLVVLGTIGMVIFSFPFAELKTTLRDIWVTSFQLKQRDKIELIHEIVNLSKAKKKGDASFDSAVKTIKDLFVKDAATILFWTNVEVTPEDFKNLLETKASTIYEKKMVAPRTLKAITKYPPAFGMMGTIIGLVAMLYSMSDPSARATMGNSFAVAMVATLYGIMCNNLFFSPLAENMTAHVKEDFATNIMIIEGIMMIQSKLPTKYVEEKLLSFLSPSEKPAKKA